MAEFIEFASLQWPLVSILAVLVAAFLWLENKKGGGAVSHHEATRLINQEQAVVVDVRDSSEYKTGHIVEAINLPHSVIKDRLSELEKYKSRQIIVVDKLGQHAGASGKILSDAGYKVVRLRGGVSEWAQQNLPLVKA